MATARYDKNYEGWILEYTDHMKILQGKRGDSKKKQKDREYPKLSKRLKEMRYAQMLNLALELESKTQSGIVCKENAHKPVLAVDYLPKMQVIAKTTKKQSLDERKRHIKEFVEFLKVRYPKRYLHEINKEVARAFFIHYAHLSLGSLDKKRNSMAAIFHRIQDDMDDLDSPFRFRNPFAKPEILDGIKVIEEDKVTAVERKLFEIDQVKEAIQHAEERSKYLAFLWKMGFLTGWRMSDILNLQWKQVDLQKRTIDLVFGKTSEKKIKTRIYITDLMLSFIEEVRDPKNDEFILPDEWVGDNGRKKANYHCRRLLDAMGLDERANSGVQNASIYTFHGLRGTVLTNLKTKDFNRDRIDFLVGHRGKGVDKDNYDRFHEKPMESTKDMIDFLGSLLD